MDATTHFVLQRLYDSVVLVGRTRGAAPERVSI